MARIKLTAYFYSFCVTLASLCLLFGAIQYLFYRPLTLFSSALERSPFYITNELGVLGNNTPSFLHTLAFIFFMVGLAKLKSGGRWLALSFCFFIEIFFELIQHKVIGELLSNYHLFDFLSSFAKHGTFDIFDLVAIALAVILSGLSFVYYEHTLQLQIKQGNQYYE